MNSEAQKAVVLSNSIISFVDRWNIRHALSQERYIEEYLSNNACWCPVYVKQALAPTADPRLERCERCGLSCKFAVKK
jgi:hypothetical protein